jgi:hypothetical protein
MLFDVEGSLRPPCGVEPGTKVEIDGSVSLCAVVLERGDGAIRRAGERLIGEPGFRLSLAADPADLPALRAYAFPAGCTTRVS